MWLLQKEGAHPDYDRILPEHRHIYKFVRTLFNAAQLTAECAIITLVYLERLVTGVNICIYDTLIATLFILFPKHGKNLMFGNVVCYFYHEVAIFLVRFFKPSQVFFFLSGF